jgi:hypothetical protein
MQSIQNPLPIPFLSFETEYSHTPSPPTSRPWTAVPSLPHGRSVPEPTNLPRCFPPTSDPGTFNERRVVSRSPSRIRMYASPEITKAVYIQATRRPLHRAFSTSSPLPQPPKLTAPPRRFVPPSLETSTTRKSLPMDWYCTSG